MKRKLTTLLLATSMFFIGCLKEEKVMATVMSHSMTSDRYGLVTYHTIVTCSDGYIRDRDELSLYVLPIGTKTENTVYK